MSPAPERLFVDGMLIRVGKYLRCAGLDATWDGALPTRLAARRAAQEQRAFVTQSTRAGFEFELPPGSVVLASGDPIAQFCELTLRLELDVSRRLFTRCIRCNLELEAVADPATIRSRVAPGVWALHQRFWTCPRCTTLFWHGSHVTNTCRKLGLSPPTERAS